MTRLIILHFSLAPVVFASALASAQTRAHARAYTALPALFVRASFSRDNCLVRKGMRQIGSSSRLGQALVCVGRGKPGVRRGIIPLALRGSRKADSRMMNCPFCHR